MPRQTFRIRELRKPLLTAAAITIVTSSAAYAFGTLHGALAIVMVLACALVIVTWATPWIGVRILDSLVLAVRTLHWRGRQGRHHAFGGVPLRVEEDTRYVWIDGADLQRVLGTHDAPDVLAARHAGRWRKDDGGQLLLRVDSVIERLASGPERLDPRTVRLRRYFEREVVFPADERRRRRSQGRA